MIPLPTRRAAIRIGGAGLLSLPQLLAADSFPAPPSLPALLAALTEQLALPDGSEVKFPVDSFAKHCLLNGIDQLGYILSFEDAITKYEQSRP